MPGSRLLRRLTSNRRTRCSPAGRHVLLALREDRGRPRHGGRVGSHARRRDHKGDERGRAREDRHHRNHAACPPRAAQGSSAVCRWRRARRGGRGSRGAGYLVVTREKLPHRARVREGFGVALTRLTIARSLTTHRAPLAPLAARRLRLRAIFPRRAAGWRGLTACAAARARRARSVAKPGCCVRCLCSAARSASRTVRTRTTGR